MADETGSTSNAKALLQRAFAHLDRNEVAPAESLLLQALAAAPNDSGALQLMGVVRRMQGHAAEAESYYRRSIAVDRAQPQVHHNLGNLLRSQRRFDEAIAEQREAIRLKPNYVEAHLNLALALSDMGEHEAAEKSLRQALRIQPNFVFAKQSLGAVLNDLGRPKEAEAVLRQALAAGSHDPRQIAALEHNLAIALKEQRRFEEALTLFDTAQAKAPQMPAVDYNRGNTLQQLGRLEEAAASYRRALARDPAHVDALACLALVAAQSGDFGDARATGERALALDAENGIARIALAIADLEDGDFAAAEQNLRLVLENPRLTDDSHVSFALGFAADALDRHGQVLAAFAVQSASNERRRRLSAPEFENRRAVDEITRLTSYFDNSGDWPASPPLPPQNGAAAGHVFVLGFMRSGTTLLATILAGRPQVLAIDERELLTDPARAFLLSQAGLQKLAALDEREIVQWRNAYWKSARDAGLPVAGKVFVDKMPFNSLRLPLIARLFPDAKVLFALRDPRDVVLSCFRRRFNMGPYSFEFLRLDDCARFYACAMTLAERYRARLPLNLLEHRYEDMIADFDSTVRAACEFAGIDWSASMRDFSVAAGEIDRRSPSAAQVRRGLYRDAAGQWRRYKQQLEPVLPILRPWIERYGYPAD